MISVHIMAKLRIKNNDRILVNEIYYFGLKHTAKLSNIQCIFSKISCPEIILARNV